MNMTTLNTMKPWMKPWMKRWTMAHGERAALPWQPWLLMWLLVVVTLTGLLAPAMGAASTAHAAGSGLRYHRGYSVQVAYGRRWLCYGWASRPYPYHCTTHFHAVGGHLVSDHPAWVPNVAGSIAKTASSSSASARTAVRGSSGSAPVSTVAAAATPAVRPQAGTSTGTTSTPATTATSLAAWAGPSAIAFCGGPVDFSNAAQWATPHGCFGQIFAPNAANYPYRPSFGWCNWASEESHLQFAGYGALGQTKHYGAPRVGSVVWFAPGDQGASADGHWATLVAMGPNGWGLVEEMNFTYRGGGWAKIDYRFIQMYAPGTAYLY